jgi:hypothetical protein
LPGIRIHAQITFEKEYPLENIQYFYVTDSDGVFVNYSIYSSSDSILSIINVSKYLINDDDLYELVYVFQTSENGNRHYHTHIIDGNSRPIECFNDQFMWIMSTANGPKLIS